RCLRRMASMPATGNASPEGLSAAMIRRRGKATIDFAAPRRHSPRRLSIRPGPFAPLRKPDVRSSPSPEPPRMTLQITIDRLGHHGDGIARTETGVVFAAGLLPGEVAEGELQGDRLVAPRILSPSPHRVKAPC